MNTPLFLRGIYCQSLDDLKAALRSPETEKEALLAVIADGVLEAWLLEGDETERRLAQLLRKCRSKDANPNIQLKTLFLELDIPLR